MEPLTIREFIRYIFFKSTIKRLYSRQISKRDIIKQFSDKFSMTDDLYITKPNPKRFVGSFIPDTDNFIANMTYSLQRYSYTMLRLIEIHGSIREESDRIQIGIDYKQTSEVRKQNWALFIINFIILLVWVLRVRDFFTALTLCFFMILATVVILVTSYNKIKKQISYTENFLIFDNKKTAGNTR